MKVLVAVKRVVDYNVKVHALPDGSGLDVDAKPAVKRSMNPFDEIAVEAAVQLKEAGKADEVVVVSAGGAKTADTIRVALAMGADRGIHVKTDEKLEPLGAARLIAAVAQREKPDLIAFGKQAIDDDAAQTGAMVSAILGIPFGPCADKVELEGGTLVVTSQTTDGKEVRALTLPAAFASDLRLAEPRYVTLPSMMKARRKLVETLEAATLGADYAPKLRTVRFDAPASRKAGVRVSSVGELVEKLRNEAKVL
ncbi:MAG: electron transfer flavoprotein subunit beta/FixA family protein [Sutterellaceae bacterium]|nr:electron transfer flavoprotein subunit beta/FixA family protein [Sutterellaceae bacterium]MDD7441585.1 electron transfer flavoprotein subunit beta/FixA family protein [Sutterellaceae bacterium]MDY2868231.1 electron transfer flavoprotein subunit beta/FixA family protein [Mesosutterella sp.]